MPPLLHTEPPGHGLVSEHVRAHIDLPPIVAQVAPSPQELALVHARVHVPAEAPVFLMQKSVRSAAQSAALVHVLPTNDDDDGESAGSVSLVEPSSGHGPASPPQGAPKPPPEELEHAAPAASIERPRAREANRVVNMVAVPLRRMTCGSPVKSSAQRERFGRWRNEGAPASERAPSFVQNFSQFTASAEFDRAIKRGRARGTSVSARPEVRRSPRPRCRARGSRRRRGPPRDRPRVVRSRSRG